MSLKERYFISEISSREANLIVVENHYLHRKAQGKYCFGLFENNGFLIENRLVGVVMYGSPASHHLCIGVCGKEYMKEVIELTRLWVDDSVGKNGESFLINNTIKLIPNKIIVSYSEPAKGHLGIVYQASNFMYTGMSDKRRDRYTVGDDMIKHHRHNRGKFNDSNTVMVDRPQKHRYVFINARGITRKILLKNLRYKQLSYPKNF